MFTHYCISAWRNVVKNALFSIINIFGLAVGLTSCILILLFVKAESGFDSWVPNADRIVRLHTAYTFPGQADFLTVRSAGKMKDAITNYAPNYVEVATRIAPINFTVSHDKDAFSERIMFVDASFFDVFDLPFVRGDKASSFAKPLDLVVTERTAIKYFGSTDVVGKTLTICCIEDKTHNLEIAGVIKDFPNNSHFNLDFIVRIEPEIFKLYPNILDTFTSVNVYTYFKLMPNTKLEDFQQRIYQWVDNESPFHEKLLEHAAISESAKATDSVKHRVMPLENLHLDAKQYAGTMGDLSPMGDRAMINTFAVVALLIIVIASINFINLTTAKSSQRAKEVAMRKVLGASRSQVAVQFLSEAIVLVYIALFFALAAVEVLLPIYSNAIGIEIEFSLLAKPSMLLGFLLLTFVIALGAGIYPAMYLSRYMPGDILQSSKGAESGASANVRFALVIFQFAISIFLLVCTGFIYAQTIYSNAIDVGYTHNNKLVLDVGSTGDNKTRLRQEMLALNAVTSVVFSSEVPSQDNENNTSFTLIDDGLDKAPSQTQLLNHHSMGYGFFEAYNITPLAGRLFSEAYGSDAMTYNSEEATNGGSAILNESAVKKFGFLSSEQAIGSTLFVDAWGGHNLTIIGVIPDVYFRSIKFSVRPSVYMLNPKRLSWATVSYTNTNVPKLVTAIEKVWASTVPMQPVHITFLNEMMAAQYKSEAVQAKLFSAFSFLAILVACLGLYGLAAFTAERRAKEIGVRKVMGAGVRDIVILLVWQFSRPVLLANLIAWPIAIYAMANWLQGFTYRLELYWVLPICVVAGILSLIVAWLTVGGNAAKVANANPIKALRCE